MELVPFYLGCLAHASYLLGSKGEAIVIDPQRDVDIYVDEARRLGLRIAYIIETHLHADFVSGHRELAQRTGAQIVFGQRAGATFPHVAVRDGDELSAGDLTLHVFETPGHTPEGISILVRDGAHPEAPAKLFTGDTLFIGDVGRPDLVGSKGYTAEQMAGMMYDSLHGKLLALDDATEVYPAHGAGSLCGRNMSTERMSTIGAQRATNPALAPMSKSAFVAMMTSGLPEAPQYFAKDAELNRGGAPAMADIPPPAAMTPEQIEAAQRRGVLLLDVRPSEVYGPRHIARSVNIGLDGQFASWAGTLIPFDRAVAVVAADRASVDEAVMRLARIGFSSVEGYLEGGIEAWADSGRPTVAIAQISPADLADTGDDRIVLDVRRTQEFETGVRRGAISLPLAELERRLDELDPQASYVIVCGSGYRSSIATSILEAHGFAHLANVEGGMNAYAVAGLPIVVPTAA